MRVVISLLAAGVLASAAEACPPPPSPPSPNAGGDAGPVFDADAGASIYVRACANIAARARAACADLRLRPSVPLRRDEQGRRACVRHARREVPVSLRSAVVFSGVAALAAAIVLILEALVT
jgi:hypothetical protein